MITIQIPVRALSVQDKKIRKKGKQRFIGNSEKSVDYKKVLSAYAMQQMRGYKMLTGNIIINKLYFIYRLPKNASAEMKNMVKDGYHIFRDKVPDCDNIMKGLFDAFNEIVWSDDKGVVFMKEVGKVYGSSDMIYIEVYSTDTVMMNLGIK